MDRTKRTRLSRRAFLRLTGVTAGSALLAAACRPAEPPAVAQATPTLQVVATRGPTAAFTPTGGGWAGQVRDTAGQPLANARVTLVSHDGTIFREARAGADGRYAFEDAPAGTLTLGASALGYEYQEAPLAAGGLDFTLGPDTHPGRWRVVSDTQPQDFSGHNSAVLLPDGRILYCTDTRKSLLFDPRTGEKTRAHKAPSPQSGHALTLLPDGRVLYVGGGETDETGDFSGTAVDTVKAYDPVGDSWEVLPALSTPRWSPGLARLADGRFLVFGGRSTGQGRLATCELFDPRTGQWTPTGDLTAPGGLSPCVLLLNGAVLTTWFPPQLYDPASGQWRATGVFNQALRAEKRAEPPDGGDDPDFAAVLLDDGRVVALGVRRTAGTTMVELYDPASGQWSLGTSPETLRSMGKAVLLPTGNIFFAGGKNESGARNAPTNDWGQTRLVDLYDPAGGLWQRLGDMKNARGYDALALLVPDGRVVVTAGTAKPGVVMPDAGSREIEAFEPAYFFRGPRPRITQLSSTRWARGSSFTCEVSGTVAITRLVLIGTSAVTYWMDGGVPRRLSLPFTQNGPIVSAPIPSDAVLAMPGFYLLYALVDDIPSEGVLVQIE